MLELLAETQEVTLVVKEPVGDDECELHGVLLPLTEGEALTVRLGERVREVHVLAESEGVSEELTEAVAQVVALCEGLSVPEGVKLPEEVAHPEGVVLWLEVCEAHWLLLCVGVLLGHWVGEAEGEPVPERLLLGEREGLREAHTVGVCVLHTVPLSVTIAEEVRDMVVVGLSEGDTETLPVGEGPAGELEDEAVPTATPKVELGLVVSLPLVDIDGVRVEDARPEAVKLELEEKELLAEAHCVLDREAHWEAVRLAMLLALGVKEAVPEAVPRNPSAAAPSDALGLPV